MTLYYTEPRDTPYKNKIIAELDAGFIRILGYDSYHDCYCLILEEGFMTIEEAKAIIDKMEVA